MPEFPYSDNMYSGGGVGLDDDLEVDPNEYAAGLGLSGNDTRPGNTTATAAAATAATASSPSPWPPSPPALGRAPHNDWDSLDDEHVLSPSDGYFTRSGPTGSAFTASGSNADPSSRSYLAQGQQDPGYNNAAVAYNNTYPSSQLAATSPPPTSSQVPRIPDRWVSDPSLNQGTPESDKAKEAREERDQNRRPFAADHWLNPNLSVTSRPTEHDSTTSSPFNPQPYQPFEAIANHHSGFGFTPSGSSSTPYNNTHRYTPSSSSANTRGPPISQPHRSSTAYSERSSLFSEAPPAYTPSPTSPTSASGTTSNNYQTFSPTMGRPEEAGEESQGLLAGQTYQIIPQSMGGEPEQHDENEFTYPEPGWRDRLKLFSLRSHWKLILLGLVLLFVTLGFLVTSITGIKNRAVKAPVRLTPPASRPDIIKDKDGTRLSYPPFDRDLEWDQERCASRDLQSSYYSFDLQFSDSRNISLFQDVQEVDQPQRGKGIHVTGDVVIRRAGSGTPGPSIVLETLTNDAAIRVDISWDDREQELYIKTPRSIPWSGNDSPCLQIRATIWTPPDSVIESLNVEGIHLGVKLLDNLSLKLTRFARLASTVGTIVAATDGEKDPQQLMHGASPSTFNLDTRYIETKTISASIYGSWPLYDYLGLETISGNIRVGLEPKEALEEKPRPAILYAHSTSGAIEMYEPVADAIAMWAAIQSPETVGLSTLSAEKIIPPRQYGVDIYTMSGTVTAALAFGYSFKVHTTSGKVTLNLLPVLDQQQASGAARGSTIDTSTTSGTTNIKVLDALWSDISTRSYVPPPTVPSIPNSPDSPDSPEAPIVPTPPEEFMGDIIPIGARDPYDIVHDATSPSSSIKTRQPQGPSPPTPPTLPTPPTPPTEGALAKNPALRVLSGRHTATSANLFLTYPSSWEGYIDTDSLSGRISVGGPGVKIIKKESSLPGIKQRVLALKGDQSASSQIKVHTTSGNIGVLISE